MRTLSCVYSCRLQYPKATWIRLGNDFDVRSIIEDKCDEWRKEAADAALAATKGVFISPISKVRMTSRTVVVHSHNKRVPLSQAQSTLRERDR